VDLLGWRVLLCDRMVCVTPCIHQLMSQTCTVLTDKDWPLPASTWRCAEPRQGVLSQGLVGEGAAEWDVVIHLGHHKDEPRGAPAIRPALQLLLWACWF